MVLSENVKYTLFASIFAYLLSNSWSNKVTIDYSQNETNEEIIKQCPSLKKYNPTIYLNGFLHTVVASFLPRDKTLTSTKELIGTTGISVDWVCRDIKDN